MTNFPCLRPQLSQLEHVLKRPDSYIGSVEHLQAQMWVFDAATKSMVQKQISYVPGLFKIFDEILVNAADNKVSEGEYLPIDGQVNGMVGWGELIRAGCWVDVLELGVETDQRSDYGYLQGQYR